MFTSTIYARTSFAGFYFFSFYLLMLFFSYGCAVPEARYSYLLWHGVVVLDITVSAALKGCVAPVIFP